MTEDWELDFSNPPRTRAPKWVTCDQCKEVMHKDNAITHLHQRGQTVETLRFCCQDCRVIWRNGQ